jgi:hypothetical protein
VKELELRKFHRLAGAVLAPFIILQAVSGVLLSIDWLLGVHQRIGETFRTDVPAFMRIWDMFLVEIHYGIGKIGAVYHIVLGIGIVFTVVSGLIIFLRIRKRTLKKRRDTGREKIQ